MNTKSMLTEKDLISMLWPSYLLLLHVDGFSITMKSNCTYESLSLVFLIMPNEVIRPHSLTSEPSGHYIAMMRYLCREFTVNDLICIVQKLIIFQVSVSNGDLKVARSTQGKVYVAPVRQENMK